jgi:hypothetical protein
MLATIYTPAPSFNHRRIYNMPSSTQRSILPSNPTYAQVRDCLGSRSVRTVANNTVIHEKSDGIIALALHGNEIIRYHPDGKIEIRDGGYASQTTKRRLNQFSPARISTVKGNWFISFNSILNPGKWVTVPFRYDEWQKIQGPSI